MRKRLLSVVLCVLLVFMCTACGSGKTEEGTDEAVTLTYWNFTMTDMPFERDLIKKFEAKNPKIKLDVVEVPVENFHDKLILAAETDTLPDIAQGIPEWTADMLESDVLENITDEIEDVKDIYGDALGLCAWDGDYYALPFRFGTSGIFVNTSVVEEAGVKIPENWTWEEFCDIAKDLTDKEKGVYGFGIPGAASGDLGLSWNFLTFALGNGSGFMKDNKADFSNKASAEGLEELCKLMAEGVLPASTVNFTASDVVDAFGSGKIAMFMNGPWYTSTIKASYPDVQFSTVQIPIWNDNAESFSVNGGTYMSLCSGTEQKKEALTFIKYMTGEENMREWASQGEFLPAVQSLLNDEAFTEGVMGPFAAQAKLPSTTIAATADNTALMEILQTEIDNALLGKKTPEAALEDASAKWNKILAEAD